MYQFIININAFIICQNVVPGGFIGRGDTTGSDTKKETKWHINHLVSFIKTSQRRSFLKFKPIGLHLHPGQLIGNSLFLIDFFKIFFGLSIRDKNTLK